MGGDFNFKTPPKIQSPHHRRATKKLKRKILRKGVPFIKSSNRKPFRRLLFIQSENCEINQIASDHPDTSIETS